MCGARRHREFGDVLGVRDAQPMLAHVLDVLGPRVDERHVLAGLHHMRTGIAADRACADNGDFLAHGVLPQLL
jgi:hypothetical protein